MRQEIWLCKNIACGRWSRPLRENENGSLVVSTKATPLGNYLIVSYAII